MKNDIESRKDIEELLLHFYKKAFSDKLIGYFFTDVVPLDLETHIPVITDFWETIVLNKQIYSKNVMAIHQHIHYLSVIRKEHLDRWVLLFSETVSEMFEGDHAELMKQRAKSIANLMNIKLNYSGI